MIALDELKKLPIEERIQLVEGLWDSIARDQPDLQESPELIAELEARHERFLADPSSGISWSELEDRIRSRRA